MIVQQTALSTLAFRVAKAIDPGAFIAGGYARDSIHERPIKDVDMYIHVNNTPKTMQAARRALCYLMAVACPGSRRNNCAYTTNGYHSKIPMLVGASKFTTPLGDIDFLFTKDRLTPYDLFKTFDIGLCMVGCFDDYMAIYDDLFLEDTDKELLTCCYDNLHNVYQAELHIDHLTRIQMKYPKHRVKHTGNDSRNSCIGQARRYREENSLMGVPCPV